MKVALVTGGSAGIGKITSRELAKQGYHVLIAARDQVKGDSVVAQINADFPDASAEFVAVDMSSYDDVRALCQDIKSRFDHIDRLILNAGLFTSHIRKNEAGHEYMFAATHLGHFLMTHELMPLLKASDNARIVVTSSVAHWVGNVLNFMDTIENPPKGDKGMLKQFLLYGRSKLANILFVNGLVKYFKDEGVDTIQVFAYHPGGVKSEFYRQFPDAVTKVVFPFLVSEEKGADTQIYLATDPDLKATGGHWCRRKPDFRSPSAKNEKLTEQLWQYSERALGIDRFGS